MKMLCVLGALLLAGCAGETRTQTSQTAATTSQAATPPAAVTTSAPQTSESENQIAGTWSGQIRVGDVISMFNYVGAESGDFAPMRFRNDSAAGKKILAVCANDDLCEFTGAVEWLDEPPPPDASAIGQIVRVDSVKRLPPETP